MEKKKIILGSDHAGFSLKKSLIENLTREGYEYVDVGTFTKESTDYPIYAEKACRALLDGQGDLCILCCGTGVGMSMAANKIKGIRAAAVSDIYSTRYTRLHNDANVLCLGARVIGPEFAWELTELFITTPFEGGKHSRRIGQIKTLEENGTL